MGDSSRLPHESEDRIVLPRCVECGKITTLGAKSHVCYTARSVPVRGGRHGTEYVDQPHYARTEPVTFYSADALLSEEAVERAARAMYEAGFGYDMDGHLTARTGMLAVARAVLTAALGEDTGR